MWLLFIAIFILYYYPLTTQFKVRPADIFQTLSFLVRAKKEGWNKTKAAHRTKAKTHVTNFAIAIEIWHTMLPCSVIHVLECCRIVQKTVGAKNSGFWTKAQRQTDLLPYWMPLNVNLNANVRIDRIFLVKWCIENGFPVLFKRWLWNYGKQPLHSSKNSAL